MAVLHNWRKLVSLLLVYPFLNGLQLKMNYVNLTDDLIHVGYRWLSTVGRSYHDHQVWCYGPALPPYIKENEPTVEKLYVQKSYNVETSTVKLDQ